MEHLTIFQAANSNDQESIDQFVVRENELDLLLSEIRTNDMSGSIQHYVLIGQRGSGKSTLLRRVQAEINSTDALKSRLIAVNLSEEQAGIYRLHDLWDRTAEELNEQGVTVDPVDWTKFDNDKIALARASYAAIHNALQKAGKKLVLLLDNIDRIFENLDKQESHLFRELLINHKDVRIIGGSTRLSEHHWKYNEPFYEFFQIVRLEPLTKEEMKALLTTWAEKLNRPEIKSFLESGDGRLESLRILSDGMPRTMLHLMELVLQRPNDDSYEYLRHIVDKATAIYQERLGTLSAHQRKVLLELSFFWESASTGQLKTTARMDAKTISAALNKLTEMRYVETLPGKGKNNLYRVKERFFNLWLIMTQGGPKQKRRVKYLTIFFEIWYGQDGMGQYVNAYRQRLKLGGVHAGHAALMTQAFARSSYLTSDQRDELINEARSVVSERQEYFNLLPSTSSEACYKALELLGKGEFQRALDELSDLEQDNAEKLLLTAWGFGGLGDTSKLHYYIDQALKLVSSPETLYKAGFVYDKLKDYERAELKYLLAADKGIVDALVNLGNLYKETNRYEEAEAFYMRSIECGHGKALFNLAAVDYWLAKDPHRGIALLNKYKEAQGEKRFDLQFFRDVLLIWSGQPEKADIIGSLKEAMALGTLGEHADLIKHLLAHHQVNQLWACFNSEDLGPAMKDELQPLYYATAKIVGKKGEDAVRVMPTELAATVDEILESITLLRSKYYPK